jgi:biopolymer transport protein ExbD
MRMAGIDLGTGGGAGRKALDSEINMIPMIDLLMVTISFLLITAVWTHMARIDADAQVPGKTDAMTPPAPPEKQLHVDMRSPEKFVLLWRQGGVNLESIDVPRREVVANQGGSEVVRFPDLATRVESEWKARGQHAGTFDTKLDQSVLHTDDKTEFKVIVGVIDAIYGAHREMRLGSRTEKVPAFNVTFAVD